MNTFKKVYSTMVKAGVLMPLLVPAAIADLLPRDLDDDPATVEAYYDDQLDITAIVHPNLALSEKFSIKRSAESDCKDGIFCKETQPGIDRFGFMEWPTADAYIASMNEQSYRGTTIGGCPGRAMSGYTIWLDR